MRCAHAVSHTPCRLAEQRHADGHTHAAGQCRPWLHGTRPDPDMSRALAVLSRASCGAIMSCDCRWCPLVQLWAGVGAGVGGRGPSRRHPRLHAAWRGSEGRGTGLACWQSSLLRPRGRCGSTEGMQQHHITLGRLQRNEQGWSFVSGPMLGSILLQAGRPSGSCCVCKQLMLMALLQLQAPFISSYCHYSWAASLRQGYNPWPALQCSSDSAELAGSLLLIESTGSRWR